MYNFGHDYTKQFIENCQKNFLHLSKRPTKYLEIGVFEGRSGCWILDNLLTHPDSKYVGIDIKIQDVAHSNLGPHAEKVTLIEGNSSVVLKSMTETFDLIYIDGDHTEEGVYADSILSLGLTNRFILWDDYQNILFGVKPAIWRLKQYLPPEHYYVIIDNYQFGIHLIETTHYRTQTQSDTEAAQQADDHSPFQPCI